MSRAVSSAERKRSPARIAFAQSMREKPPGPPVHTGMSSHAETLCSSRNFSGTHVSEAGLAVAFAHEASIAPMPSGRSGPVALNTPTVSRSTVCTIQAARSRASTYCTGSSGAPGASASPPRSIRTGQYVYRSVGSPGPTISPGRTLVARPGMDASAAFSQSAFRAP